MTFLLGDRSFCIEFLFYIPAFLQAVYNEVNQHNRNQQKKQQDEIIHQPHSVFFTWHAFPFLHKVKLALAHTGFKICGVAKGGKSRGKTGHSYKALIVNTFNFV
jgi:hypothetical protein